MMRSGAGRACWFRRSSGFTAAQIHVVVLRRSESASVLGLRARSFDRCCILNEGEAHHNFELEAPKKRCPLWKNDDSLRQGVKKGMNGSSSTASVIRRVICKCVGWNAPKNVRLFLV